MADPTRSAPTQLVIQTIVSRPFMENTYVVHLLGNSDCVIVDPGFDPESITDYVVQKRLRPVAVLNTHGHADHIAGNEAMKRCWPLCPLVIGANEAFKLTDPRANLSAKYGFDLRSPPADVLVRDGEVYQAAGLDLLVLETPGHSRGHVVFVWRGGNPWVVLGGDVLFQGSIGRTDLDDGDFEELAASIRGKLYTLPDDTRILPGHGEPTTTGLEKRTNPFVRSQDAAD